LKKKPVRLDEAAEQEVLEARLWYEGQRKELGDALLDGLAETLEAIENHPEAAARVEGYEKADVRSASVRRFPYRVIYVVLRDRCRVLAFAHVRRRPGYWRDRLHPSTPS
jgi:hypothetical protein